MNAMHALGRQWPPPRSAADLAAQAARLAANKARIASRFPAATVRELRDEKIRADMDDD